MTPATEAELALIAASEARLAADGNAETARLAQQRAVRAAHRAGLTRYRIAKLSGLSQPGVKRMLEQPDPGD